MESGLGSPLMTYNNICMRRDGLSRYSRKKNERFSFRVGGVVVKKATCGKCLEEVRISHLAIYTMDDDNRCWHCWNHQHPASHNLGDFE